MDTLVRALGRFATRDIPYVIGGLSIILAFLKLIEFPFPPDPSTAQLLFSVGVAYPVGYVVQEAMSLTGLVSSSIIIDDREDSNKCKKWFFKRWAKEAWKLPSKFNARHAYYEMYAKSPDATAEIERPIFLKHIGSAIGSSWLVCSPLLAISSWRTGNSSLGVVAGAAFILSLLLILFGWLQTMEANLALSQLNAAQPADQKSQTSV
jgi:hypothetical protein